MMAEMLVVRMVAGLSAVQLVANKVHWVVAQMVAQTEANLVVLTVDTLVAM